MSYPFVRSPLRSSRFTLAALLLAACAPATAQSVPPPGPAPEDKGSLRVSGQAQVQVPADQTVISFAVETESPAAETASRDNADRMDAVFRALRGLGVQGMELETFGYSLTPQYQRPRPQEASVPVISGYRATNQIRVTVPGTDVAGEVLDAGIGAGANRVVNLSFQATDTRDARLRALELAVEAAREEALTIASAMGLELGPVLEIQGGASAEGPRPLAVAYRAAEAMAPSTPIEAGGQTVSANVTITYRVLEKTP